MTGFRHRNDGFLDNGITVSYNQTAGTQKPEYSTKNRIDSIEKPAVRGIFRYQGTTQTDTGSKSKYPYRPWNFNKSWAVKTT